MPDQIFENPRLVAIYDSFDGRREDLVHYLAIVKELKAESVLDIGCGTGSFASLLSSEGIEVIGLDPAKASLDFARGRPNARRVRWILGDMTTLPSISVDLAVMTGNVAQVFVADREWEETLAAIRRVLQPGGHLVFEARNPAEKAWREWTREKTYCRLDIPKIGVVESWCEVTGESKELVSFRWTYVFKSDGETITSNSTLRFREREAIEDSLIKTGFNIRDVREAPDRPGKEFVFIASSSKPS